MSTTGQSTIITSKCVKQENRIFSVFPGLPSLDCVMGEEDTWLELAHYVKHDLKWLLSLDRSKFWSYMIHSKGAHQLLVSFLKNSPPTFLKKNYLLKENIKNLYMKIEQLVFLVFLRLTTEKEFGEILYNNYLFTVPILLDISSIYGISNKDLVKELIDNVINSAPQFWNDLHELLPHFLKAMKVVEERLSVESLPKLKNKADLQPNEFRDLMFYLYDSVSTIYQFLVVFPKFCEVICRPEVVSEIACFYTNVLPEAKKVCNENSQLNNSLIDDLIGNTRLDMIRLVKCVLAHFKERKSEKREELVDEYLNLMMELLSESLFLTDYNKMYSIEFEIESLIQDCPNVDTIKLNHILDGIGLAVVTEESNKKVKTDNNFVGNIDSVKLNSLITEVKDILPHLDDHFINACLKYYENNTEMVIAAILENSVPPELYPKAKTPVKIIESGKSFVEHKKQPEDFEASLNDKQEIKAMKDRYAEYSLVYDDTYDDEYDDTYDDNIEVAIREADEVDRGRRPFVTPRVLREPDEEDDEEEESEEEKIEKKRRDCFVQNPAEIRERNEQRRMERNRRNVVGGPRGQGQSREVTRNRDFKGAHKQYMGNHNRKRQAGRKMNQGMIPS